MPACRARASPAEDPSRAAVAAAVAAAVVVAAAAAARAATLRRLDGLALRGRRRRPRAVGHEVRREVEAAHRESHEVVQLAP